MDHYKKLLKRRMAVFAAGIFICVGLLVYNQFWAPESLKSNAVFAFQCGLAASGALVLALLLFRYRRILADETKLRINFHQENDERAKAIRAKAGYPMVVVLSLLLVLAGMIVGYFNTTIFAVLVAVSTT
jgi:cytochrome b561